MLFNIYMRPLGEVIRGCRALCHQYADDTQLYISFSPTAGDAILSLQRCLGAVLEWMQENGLRLKQDKTEVLRVGAPTAGGLGNSLSFGGVTLPTKDGVRSLGRVSRPVESQLWGSTGVDHLLNAVQHLYEAAGRGHSRMWGFVSSICR